MWVATGGGGGGVGDVADVERVHRRSYGSYGVRMSVSLSARCFYINIERKRTCGLKRNAFTELDQQLLAIRRLG
eukprot:SAG11_NODE_232_length_11930_cov_6.884794_10_plen_74_part_00